MNIPLSDESQRRRAARLFLGVSLLFSPVLHLLGREAVPPLSRQRIVQPLAGVARLVLPAIDAQAELAADQRAGGDAPLRFAAPAALTVTPATHGSWEQLADGRLWRCRFTASGATDLNFGFSTFRLPEGATLHIISENEAYFQGPYTARDNKPHGQLWTAVVPGGSAAIELFVPAGAKGEPQLVLSQVGCGYRDLFHSRQALGVPKAGGCEIDVACPQAAPWSNEVRSVARYTISGRTLCSGTLVADVAGDLRNYFLTANHCGLNANNAASVVVYWNYQSPVCGELGGGSLAQNQSGAIFRAAKADADFALIELEEVPTESFNVFYSGWDHSGTAPGGAVGIHHPNGDVKAISFCTTPLMTINSCIAKGKGSPTHWEVLWSQGVTEPGSSGSGIWDPATHRLVGTLSGGNSSCNTPALPDCYGKFSLSWGSGSTAADRLRDWLDPNNTGPASVAGIDPFVKAVPASAGYSVITENCFPANKVVDPGETVTVSFTLTNRGKASVTNLMATLQATAGVVNPSGPQNYGLLIGGGVAVSRSFSFTAVGACGGLLAPKLQLQSGSSNLGTVGFSLNLGSPKVAFYQNFDGVVAPTLPDGWAVSLSGIGNAWASSTARADTPPNAAFGPDPPGVSDNRLTSPSFPITTTNAQLSFRQSYDLELGAAAYDGGVLEIAFNGGAFADILDAGGAFVTNGYNSTIYRLTQNPLGGRAGWSGNSGGFVTTTVNLPAASAGALVQLRWRLGSDTGAGAGGWYLDSVAVTDGFSCCRSLLAPTLVNSRISGANLVFSYAAAVGQTYFVQTKTNLADLTWVSVATNLGDGALKSFTNTITGPRRFFRLQTQ